MYFFGWKICQGYHWKNADLEPNRTAIFSASFTMFNIYLLRVPLCGLFLACCFRCYVCFWALTFTTLWANSAKVNWWYFSHFSLKTGFDSSCKLSFDNLHEMSNPILWEINIYIKNSKRYLLKILPRALRVILPAKIIKVNMRWDLLLWKRLWHTQGTNWLCQPFALILWFPTELYS